MASAKTTISGITILSESEFCWREPHIPNIVKGVDFGTAKSVRNFCGLTKIVTDAFIPPPYMFDYDLSHVVKPVYVRYSDIPLHQVAAAFPLPSYAHNCRYIACNAHDSSKHLVGVNKRCLNHILSQHSVCKAFYATDRLRHSFRIGVGKGIEKSAFIDRSLVLPLILSTIQTPDKISQMSASGRYSLERRFDVEIGHTFESCCYITRVIVGKVPDATRNILHPHNDANYYEITSAYPVPAYYYKYE